MRVVSGIYGSRPIKAPDGLNTRPTMDKVKEAMFNIIGPKVYDSIVLDLFSGSGSLGIEAISRGASKVYFNDHDFKAIRCIKDNISYLKIEKEKYEVTSMGYMDFLKQNNIKFDIILLDPPYRKEIYEDIINYLIENNMLNDDALIVCEAKIDLEEFEINNKKRKIYNYGNKKLLVFS